MIFEARKRYPANIYLFKVNNRNTRKSCEISLKLTVKTPDLRYCRLLGLRKTVVYEHFTKLTRNYVCRSSVLSKVLDLQHAIF